MYAPKDSVVCSKICSVGPTMTTKTKSTTEPTMFRLDNSFTPRSRPVATDVAPAAVMTQMMITSTQPTSGTPHRMLRPALICSTPSPTETARPKTVPMIANESTSLPGQR